MLKAVPGRRFEHRDLRPHLIQQRLYIEATDKLAMQSKIKQGQFYLAHHLHRGMKMACRRKTLE